jgi:CRISPR system Cascade subunit CasD
MTSLILRCSGPMQSWGVSSRFIERDTLKEPSKSGVIGLLCAAMGLSRSEQEPVLEFSQMRMLVRVDRKGILAYDYQTAQNVLKSNTGRVDANDNTVQSWRYFLADARFLVGLQAETERQNELLQQAWEALKQPRYPLALGRKSYVPSLPVYLKDGLSREPILERLPKYEFLEYHAEERYGHAVPKDSLEYVIEADEGQLRNDVPSDAFESRQFGYRFVQYQQHPWGVPLEPIRWKGNI